MDPPLEIDKRRPLHLSSLVEKERTSDILLLCTAIIWGINFVAMKFLLTEISPVNLILFRFFSGSILLFLLLLFFEDVKMPLKDFLHLCALGIIGITLYQFLFIYALKYTSVTNTSIIINTAPLYGGLLSSLFGFEKFSIKRLGAIIMGFLGVYIIITKGSFILKGGDTRGDLLALAASLLWALYTILSKPLLGRHSPLKVTTYTMVIGSILLSPFIPFFFNVDEFARLSGPGWAFIIFSVVFSIVIAFFLWYRGVSKIGPTKTIIYQYSIPVFAAFFAFILLNERLYVSQLIGAVVVFSSIVIARSEKLEVKSEK
jgi:drug/metabolite transporter (DMT)-like permease